MTNNERPYLQDVFRQVNELASVKARESELIKHSLDKGLNNEVILRELLRSILPTKYGIGKGKIVSHSGMSRQCDIIIYDALNCPCFYIDQNKSQVLPIEGVFAVIEVKTTLSKQELENAFEVIQSVKKMANDNNVSTNDRISIIPPLGYVICYDDERSLETLFDNYVELNKKYSPNFSSCSYSKKSPGYKEQSEFLLIENILVINKGEVYHMLGGEPVLLKSGSDALGMFITSLVAHLDEMRLENPNLMFYYGEVSGGYKPLIMTKVDGKFAKLLRSKE